MILNKLPKELQECVKKLAYDESFQYYFAYDPVIDAFLKQQKKFNEKIDTLIDFLKKDYDFFEEHSVIEILKKMKEENTSSMSKKIDERIANLIVEYMVLHGKVKAEDFDNILKLMFSN